jgi:hypothetical protein
MERIPVQRKKSTPAWLWILLLLLLLGLLYFLFFRNKTDESEWLDDTTTSQTTNTDSTITGAAPNPNQTSDTTSSDVTDLKPVYSATNKQEYVGRQVNLQNVQVHKVVNDTTFWIGDNASEKLFVTGYKNGNATQKLKEGQRVSIKGTLEKLPDEAARKSGWGITDKQAADFNGQELYLRAQEIM